MTGTSEQGQEERSLGGPSDPPNPQEAPSEAPQSHRVNPLSGQEEALAGPHPMGLMAHRALHTPVSLPPASRGTLLPRAAAYGQWRGQVRFGHVGLRLRAARGFG